MSGMALYDRCYIFEDINYINKDEDKKASTLLELMKLLKSMKGQFKITIANEQRDMETFMKEVFSPIHGEEYPVLVSGIGAWINQKIEEGVRDIKRTLLLTVTCRAKSFEEAGSYFATLDTSLQYIFTNLRSRMYCMSGEERLALLQQMLRAGGGGIPPKGVSPKQDNWKNQILPAYIGQEEDYLKLNDRYACVLFAHDYDQTLNEERVIHGPVSYTHLVYEMREVTRCSTCKEDIGGHAVDHIMDTGHAGYYSQGEQVLVDTIHHEATTEQVWVEDSAAWTETVVTGYKCSGCGATK